MAQDKKPTENAPKGRLIGLCIALLAVVIVAAVLVLPKLQSAQDAKPQTPNASETTQQSPSADETAAPTEPEPATEPEPEEAETEPSLAFPILLQDGQLAVESLFQYDGVNPDCGNQEGQNIAAIVLRNTSDTFLTEATLTLTLADDMAVHFTVTNIPAGASVMAFSTDNTSIAEDAACLDAACEATFDPDASMAEDRVSVLVNGMTIELTNQSQTDCSEIVLFCHNVLSPELFGGTTYQYVVNNLPAGASTTVDAFDCILGIAEVVRIEVQ